MDDKGLFGDREKAMEANYFRQQDERLLERLRQNAKLEEIAGALAEKLQIDNPELLERVKALGITVDTAPALFLAPLVQVAWSDGSVSRKEHETVLRLAQQREIETGSPAFAQLEEWLRQRPSDKLFDTAVEVLKYGFAVLSPKEREERIKRIVDACHDVAAASGNGLATLLALGNTVESSEEATLDAITARLRMHN
jgi:hypothetical protein